MEIYKNGAVIDKTRNIVFNTPVSLGVLSL